MSVHLLFSLSSLSDMEADHQLPLFWAPGIQFLFQHDISVSFGLSEALCSLFALDMILPVHLPPQADLSFSSSGPWILSLARSVWVEAIPPEIVATSCISISACCRAAPAKRLKQLAVLLQLVLESSAHSWGELWLENSRGLFLSLGSVEQGEACTVVRWDLGTWLTGSCSERACSRLISRKVVLW